MKAYSSLQIENIWKEIIYLKEIQQPSFIAAA